MALNVLVCGMKEEFATKSVLNHLDNRAIPYKFLEVKPDFFDSLSPACYVTGNGKFFFTNGIDEALEHIENFYKYAKDNPVTYA